MPDQHHSRNLRPNRAAPNQKHRQHKQERYAEYRRRSPPLFHRKLQRCGRQRHVETLTNPLAVPHAADERHRNRKQRSVENCGPKIDPQQLRGRGRCGVRRNQRVQNRQRRRDGQTIDQQRLLPFPRQAVNQRHHDDETDFKKYRQAHQETRQHDRPDSLFLTELRNQPVRQSPASTGMFQIGTDHGPQPQHHRNGTQGIAKSGLDGLQDYSRGHVGGQPHGESRDQHRQEGMHPHHNNQKQEKGHSPECK